MNKLNNNSVRRIASMLSPQQRNNLQSTSTNLFRALPSPSFVTHQRMTHPHKKRKRSTSLPNTENAKKLKHFRKRASNASRTMMRKKVEENLNFYSTYHPNDPIYRIAEEILRRRLQPWYVSLTNGDPNVYKKVSNIVEKLIRTEDMNLLTVRQVFERIASAFEQNDSLPSKDAKKILKDIILKIYNKRERAKMQQRQHFLNTAFTIAN